MQNFCIFLGGLCQYFTEIGDFIAYYNINTPR